MTVGAQQPKAARFIRRAWTVLLRAAFQPGYRELLWVLLVKPKNWFQPYNDTAPNRYPVIFQFVQKTLQPHSEPQLLSFGCSTGEELYSLRQYFPRAFIKGLDINPRNIAILKARLEREPDARMACAVADSTQAEASAFYDAIFCMAVFRDGRLTRPDVMRCAPFLRFEDVAEMVADIARCLKPNGLLIIRHSNFRLCDMPIGRSFETILQVPDGVQGTRLFGPDNRFMGPEAYLDAVFRKRD